MCGRLLSRPSIDICVFINDSVYAVQQETFKYVSYGFVRKKNGTQSDTGFGAINSQSHDFDAGAVDA